MRLTLRALLASMHGLLSPDEEERLREKIDQSPFAQQLVGHIRDRVTRRELSPLPTEGIGNTRDPNVIAEYLDHELSSDEVPGVEQLCFESDRHLAEVAACHQIINLVLDKPAQVSSQLRDRIYLIAPEDSNSAMQPLITNSDSNLNDESIRPSELPAASDTQNIPQPHSIEQAVADSRDVLKRSRSGSLQKVMLLIAICLLIATGFYFGKAQLEKHQQTNRNRDSSEPENKTPKQVEGLPPQTFVAQESRALSGVTNQGQLKQGESTSPTISPITYLEKISDASLRNENHSGIQLASQNGLVLEVPIERKQLQVMTPQMMVHPDRQLFVAPSGTGIFDLGDLSRLVALGPSRFQIQSSQNLSASYGRFLLKPSFNNPYELEIARSKRLTIKASSPQCLLAISVRHLRLPGYNPTESPAVPEVEIWCLSGSVTIDEESQASVSLRPGLSWKSTGRFAGQMLRNQKVPDWTSGVEHNAIEQAAFSQLTNQLLASSAPSQKLHSLSGTSSAEVRDAASRTLAYLGDYTSLLQALKDKGQRAYWNGQYQILMNPSLTSGSEVEELHQLIHSTYEDSGPVVSRILWGYSKKQYELGESARLIDMLDHSELEVRVLAFHTLKEFTGYTLGYQPEHSSAVRAHAVRKWWERWRNGEVVGQSFQNHR